MNQVTCYITVQHVLSFLLLFPFFASLFDATLLANGMVCLVLSFFSNARAHRPLGTGDFFFIILLLEAFYLCHLSSGFLRVALTDVFRKQMISSAIQGCPDTKCCREVWCSLFRIHGTTTNTAVIGPGQPWNRKHFKAGGYRPCR